MAIISLDEVKAFVPGSKSTRMYYSDPRRRYDQFSQRIPLCPIHSPTFSTMVLQDGATGLQFIADGGAVSELDLNIGAEPIEYELRKMATDVSVGLQAGRGLGNLLESILEAAIREVRCMFSAATIYGNYSVSWSGWPDSLYPVANGNTPCPFGKGA